MTRYEQAKYHGRRIAQTIAKEPARPTMIREHRYAPWLVVATVCFGAFMGQLDASIVTLAFPSLERTFHASLANVQWVSLAYLIALVVVLIPVGRFSDRIGRKLVYLYGFAVFTIASALCGLAPSLLALVGLRVLQAAGAAMLQANSVALVSMSVPPKRKRAALGIQAAAQSLGLTLGPVLGGLLVASYGWQSIFFINVPVGIIAFVAGWFLVPRTKERLAASHGDPIGLILLATGAISMLVFISGVSGLGISGAALAVLGLTTIISGYLLWRHESNAPAPLIDFKNLRATGIAGQLIGALCAYLVLFGPLVLFTQVLISGGVSVLKTGLLLSALPLGFGLAAVGGEVILPRACSDSLRAKAGAMTAILSAVLLAFTFPDVIKLPLLALLGAGLGVYIPANNASIMTAVKRNQAAATGGMVNIARGLGTAFGVAAATLALGLTSHRSMSDGQAIAMTIMAMAAFGAFLTARKRVSLNDGSRPMAHVGEIESL